METKSSAKLMILDQIWWMINGGCKSSRSERQTQDIFNLWLKFGYPKCFGVWNTVYNIKKYLPIYHRCILTQKIAS